VTGCELSAAIRDEPAVDAGIGVRQPGDDGVERARRRGIWLLLAFVLGPLPGAAILSLAAGMSGPSVVAMLGLKVVVVVVQLVHSLPGLRHVRDRYWRWTFAALVPLTFVPHLFFGAWWTSGAALIGSVLLFMPAPRSWIVVALVLVAEGGIRLVYDTDLVWTLLLVVDGALVSGLVFYVLTRLLDVLGELRATQVATARAAASQERLRAAREVFRRLGPHLSGIAGAAERARRAAEADPAGARAPVAELAQLTRRTLADVRAAALTFRDAAGDASTATPPASAPVPAKAPAVNEPRLAAAVVVVMSLTGALVNLAEIVANQQPGVGPEIAAAAGLVALVALQIYHGGPWAANTPPRILRWTLPVHFLLVYLPVPFFPNWIGMSCYLAACMLVVLRPPVSWLASAVIAATGPVYLLAEPDQPWYPNDSRWFLVFTFSTTIWTVLIFRAPTLLAESAVQLRVARTALIRMLLVQQRLGVARDVHDLVGSSLSAVALKADIAHRLLDRDPRRAVAELADADDLAHRAIAEARSLSGDEPDTSLAHELASARSILAAASIRADITAEPGQLGARTDTALAIVVREAVTNILRHSTARHCEIGFSVDNGTVRLSITNDGVATAAETGSGTGIDNLSVRIRALGGHLNATPHGDGGFALRAEVPDRSASG
jgi:signal transduction histidine kinase